MKKTTIFIMILLIVTLMAGLVLVRQNQETRRGATFANTILELLPSKKIIKNVGETVPVKVYFQTENEAQVDGVQTVVCYGDELSLDESTGVVVNTDNGFESDPIVQVKDMGDGRWCATMVATSKKSVDKLKTTGEVFAINFSAVKEGEGTLTIDQAKSMVTGDNVNSATDKEIAITMVNNTSYQILGDLGDKPACLGLTLNGTAGNITVNVGDSVNLASTINGYGLISSSKVTQIGQRITEGENIVRYPWGTDNLTGVFNATEPGVYVFETSAFDSNECNNLCTAGQVYYENISDNKCVSVSADYKNIGACVSRGCMRYVTVTAPTTDIPILNYRVSYAYVKTNDSKCFVPANWPLQIIVMGGGESKVYNNVIPEIKGSVGIFRELGGSLVLEGFNQTNNIAVFMKGPKHLQMKYAIDKQASRYGKAGGELVLTKSAATSPVYNFTAYPILSGDVVGEGTNVPDGKVDGFDYVYIKSKAKIHETVANGEYLNADLDGSCQVNSNDLQQIRKTLEEKQGELY